MTLKRSMRPPPGTRARQLMWQYTHVYPEQGVQRRLRRLGFPRPVHLLAIDHGLSLGWLDQQDGAPAAVARRAVKHDVDGVVAHRGLLRDLAADGIGNLILQLHGSTA